MRRRGAPLQLQMALALTLTLVLALVRNITIFSKVRVLVLNQPITIISLLKIMGFSKRRTKQHPRTCENRGIFRNAH